MASIFFKTFLQLFLLPALGVSVAWYGFIVADLMPSWSLVEWTVAGAALILVLELLVLRVSHTPLIATADAVLLFIIVGLPVYCIVQDVPMRPYSALDHGGIVLGLFLVALFTFPVRIRLAGYTVLDVIEAQGNLPKDSLSRLIGKAGGDK